MRELRFTISAGNTWSSERKVGCRRGRQLPPAFGIDLLEELTSFARRRRFRHGLSVLVLCFARRVNHVEEQVRGFLLLALFVVDRCQAQIRRLRCNPRPIQLGDLLVKAGSFSIPFVLFFSLACPDLSKAGRLSSPLSQSLQLVN